jgi:hypothetical protein
MLFHVWCCTAVTAEVMMVLQNYTTSENILVVPYGETYPANHDAKQATIICHILCLLSFIYAIGLWPQVHSHQG